MSHERPGARIATVSQLRRGLMTLALVSLAACTTPASTPDNPQISPNERQQAAQQHPQILAEFGGAYIGDEADYVSRIGQKVASAAGLAGQCTFTLVNTDVVNAFAVPGCYIYLTRGLLSIINSEAELAAVLGHEVGHVTAAHAQRRQNTSLLTGLGSVIAGVLTGSRELAQLAGQLGQLYTLRYSRSQEYESDSLGIRYLAKAGYDPYAAADLLEALQNHDQLQARTRGRDDTEMIPEWARTHPLTEGRIAQATVQARATGITPDALPEHEAAYLAQVDGLLFGDDPAQGFAQGRHFAHPELRIAFDAPPGFSLTNTSQAVLIEGTNGVRAQFSGGSLGPGGLDQYATRVLQEALGQAAASAQFGAVHRSTVNGVDTAILPARVPTQRGTVNLTVAAYRTGDQAYHFLALAPENAGAEQALDALFRSFRVLSAREVASLRSRRIEVVTVRAGDTLNSLADRMAFEDYKVERFLMLNGRLPDQSLRPGERVKIVVYAPR